MQVASLQAATSKLQQNISQLPEIRQCGRNWAWSPYCQSKWCKHKQNKIWMTRLMISTLKFEGFLCTSLSLSTKRWTMVGTFLCSGPNTSNPYRCQFRPFPCLFWPSPISSCPYPSSFYSQLSINILLASTIQLNFQFVCRSNMSTTPCCLQRVFVTSWTSSHRRYSVIGCNLQVFA